MMMVHKDKRSSKAGVLQRVLLLSLAAMQPASHRLIWLMALAVTGLFLAGIMGPFIASLDWFALLTLFIPVVPGIPGNHELQSMPEAAGSRAGSLAGSRGNVIGRELGGGGFVGGVCGLAASLLLTLLFQLPLQAGIAVGLALWISIMFGTIISAVLPLLFQRLGKKRGAASGPAAAAVSGSIALLIYFGVGYLLSGV
ncbi:magnesium transporter [Paenibacillus thalictri]|nr:magnesium transporter [Paenibacillus thalictri]